MIRAAVVGEAGRALAVERRPRPRAREPEVLVEVTACGVCHTDLHLQRSGDTPSGHVLGHEVAGRAEGFGDVLVYATWGCGSCSYCDRGDDPLCALTRIVGVHADGGYADAVVVPHRRHLVSLDGLDPIRAAPLADAGATSYRAVRHVLPAARAVVIGAGGLGQFAIQWLKLRDAEVTVVDVSAAKRSRALELGADQAAAPEDPIEPAPAVIDFVGTDESLRLAATLVRRGGALVLVGGAGGRLAVGMEDVPYEARVQTSVMGSRADLAAVLEHARRGEVPWQVEAVPLDQANEALERLRRGDVAGRLVLVP